MSERLACKAVGLARSTYRRLPLAATPADPDAQLRAWLRCYATTHPCHGFRRAWAALRYDEGREVNKKKVHRLWREEGLQVRVHSPRKRAGVSSVPQVAADAPGVVWAVDFQFDSTTDGKAIKIASMVDEHSRESLLHVVSVRSPPSGWLPSWSECSPRPAGRRTCCVWITVRNSFLKRCNSFAMARWACPTFRPDRRGTTATSNRSTTGYGRSASTATTGTVCSKPGW